MVRSRLVLRIMRSAWATSAALLLAWAPTYAADRTCEVNKKVVFAGLDWDSNAFHSEVAKRIIRDGYGCDVDVIPGSTIPLINGMARGDIDVIMEVWKTNTPPSWTQGVAAGKLVEVGVNFPDAKQGWYVPRYLVEGANAPAKGLKSVADLPKYEAVFRDPEEPTKGRFLNCIAGWQCEVFNTKKLAAYGLNSSYTNFRPGSGAALDAAIVSAMKRKRPVLFYYWGPTWLLGSLGNQIVMLDEPAYDEQKWKALDAVKDPQQAKDATAYPIVEVVIGANADFAARAPQLRQFLASYHTTSELVSEALAYMQETKSGAEKAAEMFLKKHSEIWTRWVPADVAQNVKQKL